MLMQTGVKSNPPSSALTAHAAFLKATTAKCVNHRSIIPIPLSSVSIILSMAQ